MGGPCGRRHELGADGITDAVRHYATDFRQSSRVELPAHDIGHPIELARMPRSPQGGAERLMVEHPADCEMEDALTVGLPRKGIELLRGLQILLQAGRLKLGVDAAQIIACEG